MSDRILVTDLQLFARHGVLPEEAVHGQRFELDLAVELDLAAAAASDDLARGVSYADLIGVASATFTGGRFNLIEAAAQAVADALLTNFPPLTAVSIEVRKPAAPIDAIFGSVAISLTRRRDG